MINKLVRIKNTWLCGNSVNRHFLLAQREFFSQKGHSVSNWILNAWKKEVFLDKKNSLVLARKKIVKKLPANPELDWTLLRLRLLYQDICRVFRRFLFHLMLWILMETFSILTKKRKNVKINEKWFSFDFYNNIFIQSCFTESIFQT